MKCAQLLLLVVLASALPAFGEVSVPHGARVPADAMVYVGWRGARDMGPGYDGSHLKAVLDASGLAAVFDTLVPQLVETVAREQGPKDGRALEWLLTMATWGWTHPSAFYLGPFRMTEDGLRPRFAFLFEAGPDAQRLQTELQRILAAWDLPWALRVERRGDVVSLSTAEPAGATGGLRSDPDFQAAMQQVTPQPVACVYVDVEAVVGTIGDLVAGRGQVEAATWPKIRDALGLDGLRRFAWTGGFRERGWHSRAFVEAPAPRRGLCVLLDAPPLAPPAAAALPATSRFASLGRLDLARIFDELRQRLGLVDAAYVARFDAAMKVAAAQLGIDVRRDLLGPLGDTWVVYVDSTVGGVSHNGVVLEISLRDAETMRTTLAKLAGLANRLLALRGDDAQWRIKQAQSGSLRVYYAALPAISPAWVVHDGRLHVAFYPQVAVAAAGRDRSGPAGLAERPAFKRAWRQLDGRRVSALTWTDLPAASAQGYGTLLTIERLAMGMADLFGLDAPAMIVPPLPRLQAHLSAALQVAWTDDAGWHLESHSPFPLSGLVGVDAGGLALSQALVLAPIAVPSVRSARAEAQRLTDIAAMRQVVMALGIYAEDFDNVFPPDLGTLAELGYFPEAELFLHPSRRAEAAAARELTPAERRAWINARTDYVYVGAGLDLDDVDRVGRRIVLYQKPRFAVDGMVMVAFDDTHVQRMRLERVRARIGAR